MDTATKGNVPVKTNKKEAEKTSWPVLQHPIAEMEHAFNRLFGRRNWPSLSRWGDFPSFENLLDIKDIRMPSLDVIDRDNEIVVRAEIPGIEKKDIDVSLSDNMLTIKGESKKEEKEEKGDYYRHEISSSSFARSVSVPSNVEASKIVANLKDGVLEVKLPKSESSKRRKIAVQ